MTRAPRSRNAAAATLGLLLLAALAPLARAQCAAGSFGGGSGVRYVRVTSAQGDVLNIGDVAVFNAAGVNVALNQPASMSSVYGAESYCGRTVGMASAANDGDACTFAATAGGANQWWQVDLGSPITTLDHVNFYIRSDNVYGSYWSYRLNSAVFSFMDASSSVVGTYTLPSNVASLPIPFSFSLSSVLGSCKACSAGCATGQQVTGCTATTEYVLSSPVGPFLALTCARPHPRPFPQPQHGLLRVPTEHVPGDRAHGLRDAGVHAVPGQLFFARRRDERSAVPADAIRRADRHDLFLLRDGGRDCGRLHDLGPCVLADRRG